MEFDRVCPTAAGQGAEAAVDSDAGSDAGSIVYSDASADAGLDARPAAASGVGPDLLAEHSAAADSAAASSAAASSAAADSAAGFNPRSVFAKLSAEAHAIVGSVVSKKIDARGIVTTIDSTIELSMSVAYAATSARETANAVAKITSAEHDDLASRSCAAAEDARAASLDAAFAMAKVKVAIAAVDAAAAAADAAKETAVASANALVAAKAAAKAAAAATSGVAAKAAAKAAAAATSGAAAAADTIVVSSAVAIAIYANRETFEVILRATDAIGVARNTAAVAADKLAAATRAAAAVAAAHKTDQRDYIDTRDASAALIKATAALVGVNATSDMFIAAAADRYRASLEAQDVLSRHIPSSLE